MNPTEKTSNRRLPQSEQHGARASSGLWPRAPKEDEPCLRKATIKDPHYLEFLRHRPCCICLSQWAEPHHVFKRFLGISYAGLGQKGSDLLAIPVCRSCHDKIHWGRLRVTREESLELIVANLVGYLLHLKRDRRMTQ